MSVTVVYRSAADLKKSEFWYEEGPKMQERAIKAEAEVERLKKVYATTNDSWKKLQTENAQLRKVVDAAHVAVAYLQTQPTIQHILVQALAELDGATHD